MPHLNWATVRQNVGLPNYEVSFGKKICHLNVRFAKFCTFSLLKSVKLCYVFTQNGQKQGRHVTMVTEGCWFLNAISFTGDQMSLTSQTLNEIWEIACPWVCQPRKNWLLQNSCRSSCRCPCVVPVLFSAKVRSSTYFQYSDSAFAFSIKNHQS